MSWRWLSGRSKCFLKQIVVAAGLALPFLILPARLAAQTATNAPQLVSPAQAKPPAHGDLKDLQRTDGSLLTSDFTGFSGSTCTSCHAEVGTKNGSISISGVPASYVPGTAYGLTVTVSDPGQSKWGFQMAARRQAATTQAGGSFSNTTANTQTLTISGIPFITQTVTGARAGTANAVSFSFNWIAPSAGAGTVQFNVAGLAANNSGSSSGDFTYTTSATSSQLFPPSAPTNLQASAVSNTQINLTWSNVANETGYRIERKTGTGGTFVEIGTVGANVTSFSSTGLSANTTYCYRVRAFNDAGNSGFSNESCATTLGPPNAPSNLQASAASSSQINLTWNDNSNNETQFRIERRIGGGAYVFLMNKAAGSTSHSDAGLSANTTYTYRVRAENSFGNSAFSNEASATTQEGLPATPTNLIATAVSTTQINLTWNDNSNNETQFRIERRIGAGAFAFLTNKAAGSTSHSDAGLTPNTTYTYRVRAENSAGNSGFSNEATAATGPTISRTPGSMSFTATPGSNPAPQNLEIRNSGVGTLNWSVSDDQPWLNLSPASGSATTETDVVSVSVNATGLALGTYNATITITAPGASNTPQTTAVTLNVTSAVDFFDDFSDGNADGWSPAFASRWRVESRNGNNAYCIFIADPTDEEYSFLATRKWTDFALELDMMATAGSGRNYFILFNTATGGPSGYFLLFSFNEVTVFGAGGAVLGRVGRDFVTDGNWHHIRVERKAPNIKVFTDNELLLNFNDATYTDGFISVGSFRSTACFDNIAITSLANRPPVVANRIPDQSLKIGDPALTRNLRASPPVFTDPDADSLTFTASTSAASIATASISNSVLTVTPVAAGNATIIVRAQDNKGGSAADTFAVAVTANRSPVVANAIPNQTLMIGGASFTRDLNLAPVVFTDPDGDVLSYSASSNAAGIATASISGSVLTVTPVAGGSATITVTANDNKGGTVSAHFTVTVNRPPVVANAIANQIVTLGGPAFTGDLNAPPAVFSDPDGDALSYTANSSATGVATASISGSVLTVTPVAAGSAIITVTANDNKGGTVSTTFTATVNRRPVVANAIANQSLTVGGAAFTRDLAAPPPVFDDPDGDILSYTAGSNAPAIARVEISGSSLIVTPVGGLPGQGGSATITVTADDGSGGTVSTSFTVAVNRPPVVATVIPNQILTLSSPPFSGDLNATPAVFSDPDGDALSYTATSSAPSIATAAISGSTLTVTAVAGGSALITITADDGKGGTVSTAFTLTVNRRPVVANAIPNQIVTLGSPPFTGDLNAAPAVFDDPDGDALSYSASSNAPGIAVAGISGSTLIVTAVSAGNATISVTASDGKGGTATTTFTATVNRPPVVANAIPSQKLTVGLPGQGGAPFTRNLNDSPVVFSDPDGDALTYTASSNATSVATVSLTGSTITVVAVGGGNATITITANDGKGGATSTTFTVTVNRPPQVANAIVNQILQVGGPAFSGDLNASPAVFTDPDGDALTYTASSSAPNIATASISGSTLTITPVAGGSATITITASDGMGGSASTTFKVTVNRPPIVSNAIADQNLTAGLPGQGGAAFTQDLNLVFSDPDGNTLAYTASSSASNIATAAVAGNTLTVTPLATGTATITVNANDGRGGAASTTFKVTVTPTARVLRVAPVSVSAGSAGQIPIALAAQGDENTVAFSLVFETAILSNPQARLGKDAGAAQLATDASQQSQGRFGVTLALPAGQKLSAGDREILVMTFSVNANPTANSTPLAFGDQPVARRVLGVAGNTLPVNSASGQVTLTRGFEADVSPRPNGSNTGTITTADWTQVGRFVARLDTPRTDTNEFQRADCAPLTCGDGRLTIADWVQAGRYASSLEPVQPACGPTSGLLAATDRSLEVTGQSNTRTIRAVNTTFTRGRKDSLRIEFESEGNENALGFSLHFAANLLVFEKVILGSDAAGALLNVNANQAAGGNVGIALALPAGQAFGNGIRRLVTVIFSVHPNANAASTVIDFGDQPVTREIVDLTAAPVAAAYTPATVTIQNLTGVEAPASTDLPAAFELGQNYPNPFNPSTIIKFALPQAAHVTLTIYNLLGKEVAVLVDETLPAGRYEKRWVARDSFVRSLPSGVYLYRLQSGRFSQTKKLVLMQ
jgi:uncharacterized protein YjdB/fibronectin type 3 domain-containing protein